MASVLLMLAVPVFFLSIGVEYLVARRQHRAVYDLRDALTNLMIGMGSEITGVAVGLVKVAAYTFAYDRLRLTQLSDPLLLWLLALIGVDFCYYWYHRLGHEVNALWSLHVVHHQSEEYNYAVALRQSWFGGLAGWVFYLPLAILGVPPAVFATAMVINLLYQFFIHTRLVGRLGLLESVLNTPSHHRVHHGTNSKYLDKNYGGILIVWDRLFGTFIREEEEPAYGIVKPWTSASAFAANLQPLRDLWFGFRSEQMWANKVRFLLMPPGWQATDGSRVDLMRRNAAAADQRQLPGRKSLAADRAAVFAQFSAAMLATVVVMAPLRLPAVVTAAAAVIGLMFICRLGHRLEHGGLVPAADDDGSASGEAAVKAAKLRSGIQYHR